MCDLEERQLFTFYKLWNGASERLTASSTSFAGIVSVFYQYGIVLIGP